MEAHILGVNPERLRHVRENLRLDPVKKTQTTLPAEPRPEMHRRLLGLRTPGVELFVDPRPRLPAPQRRLHYRRLARLLGLRPPPPLLHLLPRDLSRERRLDTSRGLAVRPRHGSAHCLPGLLGPDPGLQALRRAVPALLLAPFLVESASAAGLPPPEVGLKDATRGTLARPPLYGFRGGRRGLRRGVLLPRQQCRDALAPPRGMSPEPGETLPRRERELGALEPQPKLLPRNPAGLERGARGEFRQLL